MKRIFVTMFLVVIIPAVAFSQRFREVPENNTLTDSMLVEYKRGKVLGGVRWFQDITPPPGQYLEARILIRAQDPSWPPRVRLTLGVIGADGEPTGRALGQFKELNGGSWEEMSFPIIDTSFVRWARRGNLAGLGYEVRINPGDPGAFIAINRDSQACVWLVDALTPEPPTLREVAPPDTTWYEGQGLAVTLHLEVQVPNDSLGIVWEATNHGQMVAQQAIQPSLAKDQGDVSTAHNLEISLQPLPLPIELEVKAKSVWTVRPTVNLYSIWSDSIRVEYSRRAGEPTLPEDFALQQNYPNPFNPGTTIAYDLPEDAHVVLNIYNILGRKIRTLVDEDQKARSHTVIWTGLDDSGRSVASGVYLYKLQAGSFVETKKMLLIR